VHKQRSSDNAAYKAIKPHRAAAEFAVRMATVTALADELREATAPDKADLTDVLEQIGEVLDRSIEGASVSSAGPPAIDLSRIDFKALAKRFEQSETKNLDLERLKAAISAQLDRLVSLNETRVDLREKFEALIAAYNAGSSQIEQLFQELLHFSNALNEEQTRSMREQLTEEELVVFDLLTRPGPELTAPERDEVKKVAKGLLARLRAIATLDWQKTAQARARVKEAIDDELDIGLPRKYTTEAFATKAGVVFRHIYERYGRAA
jgi:type I restriction enzyme R subunit